MDLNVTSIVLLITATENVNSHSTMTHSCAHLGFVAYSAILPGNALWRTGLGKTLLFDWGSMADSAMIEPMQHFPLPVSRNDQIHYWRVHLQNLTRALVWTMINVDISKIHPNTWENACTNLLWLYKIQDLNLSIRNIAICCGFDCISTGQDSVIKFISALPSVAVAQ